MNYFSQFKWPVPIAFADALGQCQFGEGDILHTKKSAYENKWDIQSVEACLQVIYPPRQMNVPKTDIAEVFKKNWNSEVHVQKYICASSESSSLSKDGDVITSTQGRLYTALWIGNLNALSSETEALMPTINAKETVRLSLTNSHTQTKTNYIQQVESAARTISANGKTIFAMPYDPTNNVSSAKYEKIKAAMRDISTNEPVLLTPKEAGIDSWQLFLPTVYIALFVTQSSVEVVHDRVKKVTYVKAKNTKSNKDLYDIERHGTIFS